MKTLISSILLVVTLSQYAQKNQLITPQHEGLHLLQANDELSLKIIEGIQQIHTLKKIELVYIEMLYHKKKINFQFVRDMPLAIERYLWSLEKIQQNINNQRTIRELYVINKLFQKHQCARTRPALYFTQKQLKFLREQNSSLHNTLKGINTELKEDQAMLSYYERFLQ